MWPRGWRFPHPWYSLFLQSSFFWLVCGASEQAVGVRVGEGTGKKENTDSWRLLFSCIIQRLPKIETIKKDMSYLAHFISEPFIISWKQQKPTVYSWCLISDWGKKIFNFRRVSFPSFKRFVPILTNLDIGEQYLQHSVFKENQTAPLSHRSPRLDKYQF